MFGFPEYGFVGLVLYQATVMGLGLWASIRIAVWVYQR